MPSTTSSLLPRETRDTWLVLAAVGLVLLPQTQYLPLWTSALVIALLLYRAWVAAHHRDLPNKWQLVSLLAVATCATAVQFGTIFGPEAGVVLVVLLLVLKTLEMRARRDAMVIFFLGFFALLSLLLQSQSLVIALSMLAALWLLLAALVNAHMPAGYPSIKQLLGISGKLMLIGTPFMLVLFLSFPRVAPLWGMPSSSPQGRTGLSNDMTVGQVAELAKDSSVAMRVRFETLQGTAPAQSLLYFRGPVLNDFDGRNWKATFTQELFARGTQSTIAAHPLGEGIFYEATLQPSEQRWLLTLDATLEAPRIADRRVLFTPNLQWLMPRPITDVVRYRAQAFLRYTYGQELSARERSHYLQLPPSSNPRTHAWGQQLRTEFENNDSAIISAALTHLRQGDYVYTLQPGVVASTHTADDFWFDRRQGFCEHIASAFAVLMRTAGIPSRIVLGYQGGERNPVDGLWTVRNSDAHAWTEVWLADTGWVRIDPTAAVAPSRIDQLQRLSEPSNVFDGALYSMLSPSLLAQIRANWEAINHRWNDWVLNYSSTEQRDFLSNLHLTPRTFIHAAFAAVGTLLCALLGLYGLRWYRQRTRDPWLHLMHQMRQQCVRAGIHRAPQLSIQELIAALEAHWGAKSAGPFQQWLRQMEQSRYALHSPHTLSLAALRSSYRALIWPLRHTP